MALPITPWRTGLQYCGVTLSVFAAVSLQGLGCSVEGQSSTDVGPSRVMVIDEGFDLSLPVFSGKVEAAYTVRCKQIEGNASAGTPNSGSTSPGGTSLAAPSAARFDVAKAAMLAKLQQPDDGCELQPGIATKVNPFIDLEKDRAAWNSAIRAKQFLNAPQLSEQLILRLWAITFHGTATAGIIAEENPGVRFVLVERSFATASAEGAQSDCLSQEAIDEAVSLLSDPEIRAAYVAQPPSRLESALATARATHGIEIVSESYGKLSRVGVEEWLSELQCSPVSLERYYVILTELERNREGNEANGALITKAAGNENALLNGPEDSVECRLGDSRRLLVGSYGTNGQRSNFSNYGNCVDLYAPGEDVIVHLPGDWLFPLSGTSFAAPLVTRLLSMTSPRPFDPDTAKANLLGQRGADLKISRNRFPSTMLWSMTTQTDAAGSQALQTSVRPLRPSPRQVTRLAWHNAVWPIEWVQAWRRFSRL